MLRVTARVLIQQRPHNFKHKYIYPASAELRARELRMVKPPKSGKPRPERPLEERISRQLSSTLRHNALKQGLNMREDGFVNVTELLSMPRFHSVDFITLERVVSLDAKNRYTLSYEAGSSGGEGTWWIRANQGHSIESVEVEMTEVTDASQVPLAVHGTNKAAWERIRVEGLSRMGRQHVHFAQGVPGSGVISGMRSTSQVYIYLDVPLALAAGLRLLISQNGVLCCSGDENGYISPQFFSRVEWAGSRQALPGWDESPILPPATADTTEAEAKIEEPPS